MRRLLWLAIGGMAAGLAGGQAGGQQAGGMAAGWTTAEDHRNMMEQLGIRALRPGPSGNPAASNAANYDEAKANPFPDYPPLLRTDGGVAVRSAEQWWRQRRPEIVEHFEREVFGRAPAAAPAITWRVKRRQEDRVGPYPVQAVELAGVADNRLAPGITVEIQMVVVTPAWTTRPVPLMILFGRAALPSDPVPAAFARFAAMAGSDPPATEQLIGAGWGYALLNPNSIQADNGAGLTKGIIGLANQGRPRKPEDWGALRAWAWGASRALDYLESVPGVDARRVGIEGVSRYGKAALVTMAFDPRFAVALVGSSGEGGAKPHRRNFGEAVENLTGAGEYHWMAGNFLKYGAADAVFGSKSAADLPVDSHQLIALCAPRLTFISYGIPEKGDAKWLDQRGSFMATVAAGEVYRLLGARGVGVEGDFREAALPPVNAGLLEGQLAWRQHDGGHTDGPNWKYFLPWAARGLGYERPRGPAIPANQAAPRLDANSLVAHGQLLEKAKQGRIDLYFVGDSITRRWGATDYPRLLAHWRANFTGWHAANFGWGGDQTQHILWRLSHGEMEGVKPKVVVVQAGTNNISARAGEASAEEVAAEVASGVEAIVRLIREKAPEATLLLTGVFPRGDVAAAGAVVPLVNRALARLADGKAVRFVDVSARFRDGEGRLVAAMFDPDRLHLAEPGYQAWADALKPHLREVLGAPEAEDRAPAATGDPSKQR